MPAMFGVKVQFANTCNFNRLNPYETAISSAFILLTRHKFRFWSFADCWTI